MESAFWEGLVAGGHRLPADLALADLTAELTEMLGSTDPHVREGIAYGTLGAWIGDGVYDDLLAGLGDGMAAGLDVGLGDQGTDTVFRRAFSALALAGCIERDNARHLVPAETVLRWGDRIAGWFVRERDLRGFVPGKGWAHAVAHGADAIGVLAGAEAMGRVELTVLLDVLADRLVAPTQHRFVHGEDNRMATATMRILHRELVGLDLLEPWLARVAKDAITTYDGENDPFLVTGNVQGYLRALYLQLSLAPKPPSCRADLLLSLIDALKLSNPNSLA